MMASASTSSTDTLAPAPRFATLWASLVYAAGTLLLGWQALLGKFLVGSHSDQYIAGYPFREFAASTLRETGSFPQWNPYQFGGMPYIAAMHGDIFYPTFLLRMIMPTDVAMTWAFMIHLFLAGLFAFIFLRKIGLSFWAALLGGLAYMMGGHVASHVSPGHDGKLYVSALFPILLWCLVAGIRDGRKWAWGLLAIVVGLDVLSPHPQLLQYSLLAAGAYAIFLAVRGVKSQLLSKGAAIQRLALALGAVVIGGLIGAIQYLPVSKYVDWSPRAEGIGAGSYEHATSYGWNPQELLNVYIPEFTGILDKYWGPNGIHFHSDYVGVIVLMIGGAAFIGLRANTRRSEIWFWAITLIVTLLWSLGGYTPFYKIPYYLVPGTKFFRAPATIFFIGSLAIAFLTAIGLEQVLKRQVGKRYILGWGIFGVLMYVLAVTGGLTNFANSIAQEGGGERVYSLIFDNAGAVTFGALRALIFVLLTGAVLWLAWDNRIKTRVIALAITILCMADLWSVLHKYWAFSPPASELYVSNPAIDFLRDQPQPVRVLPLSVEANGWEGSATYRGSGLMVHHVRNVIGYHGNQIRWYNDLLALPDFNTAIGRIVGSQNVQRVTNTQFILTDTDSLEKFIPDVTRVFGPVPDGHGNQAVVYALPTSAPFAWVAPVIVKAPNDAVMATLGDPRFDVTRAALFDTAAPVTAARAVNEMPPATGIDVHVDQYAPGHVRMTLAAPAPAGAALIASEAYYPGWTATVDGQPAKIGRAQFAFIGVELPTGAREVELTFETPGYATGKTVTLIAIVVAVLVMVGGAVMEKRRVE